MKLNLGKVACIPRGEYDAEAVYSKLNIVTYKGSSYLVIVDSITGVTPEVGERYMLLAEKGNDGEKGADGYTPQKGIDYFDGEKGADGAAGRDGKTPENGVDYNTEADKAEFVQKVLNALPTWTGGAY